MNDFVTPVLRALDALDQPLDLFIRDDDAGWSDDTLLALLDVTARARVPIDLAAIPLAVSPLLALELNARIDAMPGLLAVHQHGCAHLNHQTEGRKCEFGDARDAHRHRADLMGGRLLLEGCFGARLQRFFTPPWNRCAELTPALLAELGYRALSRDRGAPRQSALPELPVDIDWSRQHREGGLPQVAHALATAVRERGRLRQSLGLMLHHAAMSVDELDALGQALSAWARHPQARWRAMADLIASAAPATPPHVRFH